MLRNNKGNSWLHNLRIYGLNAILGFGLGVFIVMITLSITGIINGDGDRRGKFFKDNMQIEGAISEIENSDREKINTDKAGIERSKMNMVNDHQVLEDYLTVLIIGMDNRPEEDYTSNTDTIIVASINPQNKKMVLLSIPRDTQVMMDNGSKQKINALARLGNGIPSTEKYIEDLLGHPIDGYVVTNFEGFKNIIDTLGGITVTVEKDMYHDTGDKEDRYINLRKGTQRLNGSQALQYARFRNDELADISRVQRQQQVIKAILAEASNPFNIPKIPFLLPQALKMVETDLSVSQIWSLATELPSIKEYKIISHTLPGSFLDEDGISYWRVEGKETKNIIANLFEGKKPPIFSNSTVKPEPPKDDKPVNNLNIREPEIFDDISNKKHEVEKFKEDKKEFIDAQHNEIDMKDVLEKEEPKKDPKESTQENNQEIIQENNTEAPEEGITFEVLEAS